MLEKLCFWVASWFIQAAVVRDSFSSISGIKSFLFKLCRNVHMLNAFI